MTASRPWVADILIALVLAAVCLGMSVFKEADVDVGFHIRTGEHVVRTGTIPQKDIFSYTSAHKDWPLHYWIPDTAIYWMYTRWGVEGLILAKAAVVALIFLVLYVGLRRLGVAWFLALLLVVWALVMARPRFSIRPLLGSQLFLSILVVWLMHWRVGRGLSLRFLPVLLMVWANIHAGFVFGLILLATVSGTEIINRIASRLWGVRPAGLSTDRLRVLIVWSCLGVGAAALLVWVMNPKSLEGLFLPFEFYRSSFFMSVIQEYGPVTFPRDILFGVMVVLAAVSFVVNRRGLDWTDVAVCCVFGYLAASSVRIVIVFGIVVGPIIARNLQCAFEGSFERLKETARPWMGGVAVAAACCVLLAGGYLYAKWDRAFRPGLGFDPRTFPEKAFEFIERQAPDGEIFNSDMWGGPMILRLYPRYKVFIDGRQEVYGEAFWQDVYFRILSGGPGWDRLLDEYGVNIALLRHSGGGYGHRISELLWASPEWALVYWDDLTSIFARRVEKNRRLLDREYKVVDPDAFSAEKIRTEGRLSAAVAELERKVSEDPVSWRGRLYLGLCLLSGGEPERAREQFRAILRDGLMETRSGPLSGIGDAFYAMGLPDSALVYHRWAREEDKDDFLLLLKEIQALGALGRVEEARKKIRKISPGQDRLDAWSALWGGLFESGHVALAAEVLDEGTREYPGEASARYMQGLVFERLDRTEDAEAAYRRALALRPEFPEALNNLAWLVAAGGGRIGEAVALAERARAMAPGNVQILDTLGWIQFLAEDYAAASRTLFEAVEALGPAVEPGASEIFYHLGEALAASGDRAAAVRAFRRALQLQPDHPGARQALSKLGQE